MVKNLRATSKPNHEERPVKRAKFVSSSKVLGSAFKKTKASLKIQAAKHSNGSDDEISSPPPPPNSKGKNKANNGPLASSKQIHGSDSRPTTLKTKTTKQVLSTTFQVIVGSYEKLLYGIEGKFEDEAGAPGQSNPGPKLKPVFIFPAHVSCVKAVGASPGGKWLATGSTDEIIKVWDLRRRKEVGGLIHHQGSITHLSFPTKSHLISASEDGTICIFTARDWVVLRTLKGHKGRVNCVAVHPSGKVALSVGQDRTVRMWDLMRGKGTASTKIGKEGEIIRWSTDGARFAVLAQKCVDVYSTQMTLLHTLTHNSRLHDLKFWKPVDREEDVLLVSTEDKKVTIYSISGEDSTSLPVLGELVGHNNRVKAIDALDVALHSGSGKTSIVSTISSDGFIRIFDLASLPETPPIPGQQEKVEIQAVAEYDTKGTRLVCCTLTSAATTGVVEVEEAKPTKRKRGGPDGSGSDSEGDGDEGTDAEQ